MLNNTSLSQFLGIFSPTQSELLDTFKLKLLELRVSNCQDVTLCNVCQKMIPVKANGTVGLLNLERKTFLMTFNTTVSF